MIFSTHTLANGLRIVHYRDKGSRFAVVNVLYNVGSRNEEPYHTGLAHLFEHLMFGGTPKVPDFDIILQQAGGQSNAWTSTDLTNFYDQLPLHNVETALWLEADRMAGLAFSEHSLDVQRKVVCEEFKETVYNAPYGDIMHIITANTFTEHPYRTPVIGKELEHIQNVSMDVVRDFFYRNYYPANAILSVVADIDFEIIRGMADKYFGSIPNPNPLPEHTIAVDNVYPDNSDIITVERNVPDNVIFKAYHMCGRCDKEYVSTDILTDILSLGTSSRFMRDVVVTGNGFSALSSSVWGTLDPGLLFIKGTLKKGVSYKEGDEIINEQLEKLCYEPVSDNELRKVINKAESLSRLENISQEELAHKMAYFTLLGNIDMLENEYFEYRKLTPETILNQANKTFRSTPLTLYYGK